MFWRFALGDAEAGIWRPKVIFLILRYCFILLLTSIAIVNQSVGILLFLLLLLVLYIVWSISKNFRYVNDIRAFFILPLLQFTADFAVLHGTFRGILSKYIRE